MSSAVVIAVVVVMILWGLGGHGVSKAVEKAAGRRAPKHRKGKDA